MQFVFMFFVTHFFPRRYLDFDFFVMQVFVTFFFRIFLVFTSFGYVSVESRVCDFGNSLESDAVSDTFNNIYAYLFRSFFHSTLQQSTILISHQILWAQTVQPSTNHPMKNPCMDSDAEMFTLHYFAMQNTETSS